MVAGRLRAVRRASSGGGVAGGHARLCKPLASAMGSSTKPARRWRNVSAAMRHLFTLRDRGGLQVERVVRNLISVDACYLAKRKVAAAWKLERRLGKAKILQRYLNAISYGNHLVGPQAAARAYFDKDAADLTLAEAVYLAGLPQAPLRLNPWRHPAAGEFRYGRSVRRLAALGVIPQDVARHLADSPPHLGPSTSLVPTPVSRAVAWRVQRGGARATARPGSAWRRRTRAQSSRTSSATRRRGGQRSARVRRWTSRTACAWR